MRVRVLRSIYIDEFVCLRVSEGEQKCDSILRYCPC